MGRDQRHKASFAVIRGLFKKQEPRASANERERNAGRRFDTPGRKKKNKRGGHLSERTIVDTQTVENAVE